MLFEVKLQQLQHTALYTLALYCYMSKSDFTASRLLSLLCSMGGVLKHDESTTGTALPCRHPYKRVLTLTNGSKLPCKCEVMGQEARSQGLATFTTSPTSGVIPAKGTLDVEITLQASRLGRIQLPLQVKVCCFPHPQVTM